MVSQILIPTGRQGTTEVLAHMARLVRESARQPIVRHMSVDLVRSVYASRYADVVWGLKNFFMRHFRFIDEPDEMITASSQSPQAAPASCMVRSNRDGAVIISNHTRSGRRLGRLRRRRRTRRGNALFARFRRSLSRRNRT